MPIDNVNGGLLVAIQLILPCAPYLLYSISHFSQRRINAVKLLVLRSLDLWHQRFDDPLEKGNVRSQLATETHFVPDCCSALSCYPELLQFPEASLKSPKPFRCKPQAFQCFLIGGSEPPNYWTPWQAENVSPWKVPYLFCPYYIMIGWDAGAVSVVFPFNTDCCVCLPQGHRPELKPYQLLSSFSRWVAAFLEPCLLWSGFSDPNTLSVAFLLRFCPRNKCPDFLPVHINMSKILRKKIALNYVKEHQSTQEVTNGNKH